MVYFGPAPKPPGLTKLPELRGRNLPAKVLIEAYYKIETGPFHALRCCLLCEVYWLVPDSMGDPGVNFICPECQTPTQGPYR